MSDYGSKKNCMFKCFTIMQIVTEVLNSLFVTAQEFNILSLIREVKKHPILYAKDIKASKESREEAWLNISNELAIPRKCFIYMCYICYRKNHERKIFSISVQIVKMKWRSLRDSLSRLKRDRSRRGKKTWYMLKHLTFLPSVTELL